MEETPHDITRAFQEIIASAPDIEGTGFQAMLASLAEALQKTLHMEEYVAQHAISLAQQERFGALAEESRTLLALILNLLNHAGKQILKLSEFVAPELPEGDETSSWWFLLSEAISTLERQKDWVHTLLSSQPPETPSHRLAHLVEELLGHHLQVLEEEAERWMP